MLTGEDDATYKLLDCKETKHWRLKLIRDEWLNMHKEVAYRKILKITNKVHLQNLGKYLDIVKNKWLNKMNVASKYEMMRLYRDNPVLISQ